MDDESNLDKLSLDELEYTILVDSSANLLFVDDEDVMRTIFKVYFEGSRHRTRLADSAEQALEMMKEDDVDLLVTDKNLPGLSGIELMRKAKEIYPSLECIVITGFASIDSAVEAMRLGAFDYILKPFDMDLLKEKIERAVEKQHLARENAVLAQQLRDAHAERSQAQKQPDVDPSGPDPKEADISRLGEQLQESRRILDNVAQAIEQAIMRMVLISESQKIKRDDLLKIRGILEKGWLDATYPARTENEKDD